MKTAEDKAIICSILEDDAEATVRRLRQVPDSATLVEIRGDRLGTGCVERLVRLAPRPVIFTVRPVDHGGGFSGSESERRSMLLDALAAGARFVDVELRGKLADLADGPEADRVILSHHGGDCRSESLRELYGELARSGASRLKLVPRADAISDVASVRDVLRLARRDGRALACFASGRLGAVSRLMAPAWGSWATYGAVTPGAETASGQFTVRDMVEIHDVMAIAPRTRRFALVGRGVFGSPSPAMHAAAYRALGIDARYFPVELDEFEDCLELIDPRYGIGVDALAVTMPFKQDALDRCSRCDDIAAASGAANTITIDGDDWTASNTDGPAVVQLVGERIDLSGATVAIVGAGGTARAAAASLAAAGAGVCIFNRTVERGREAASELGIDARALDELPGFRWDVLVQATPLGARGERIVTPGRLTGRVVLDAVYGARTPLIEDARRCGIEAIDGFELLVTQAVGQFRLMTGSDADPRVLRQAGTEWLDSNPSSAFA